MSALHTYLNIVNGAMEESKVPVKSFIWSRDRVFPMLDTGEILCLQLLSQTLFCGAQTVLRHIYNDLHPVQGRWP